MYVPFFGLKQKPFSIAPDPRYLFMSERHREALAHLLYGVQGGGGFVLLTGEIGAGKTTVCRCFLEQIPARCNVAYIFNPKLSALELLTTVCHEFGIKFPALTAAGTPPTVKDYVDGLNEYLLRTHAVGQNNVLIIDEAQNLSSDVLEQLRLLTNLETSERKLLQIVLIGQPELRGMLARPELEQLAQRVIARYHLDALSEKETAQYIAHRLAVAGLKAALPFDGAALRRIHQLTRGVPRRINLLCDRTLLGAYASGKARVDRAIVDKAALEVFGPGGEKPKSTRARWWPLAVAGGVLVGAAAAMAAVQWGSHDKAPARVAASAASAASAAHPKPPTAVASTLPTASAAAAVTPRLRSIEDLEALLARAPHDEHDALRTLAPEWALQLGDGDPCALAAEQEVRCFRAHGGLALLRLLARPSVLALRDGQDRQVYVVLAGLGHDDATLVVGKAPLQVPLSLLTTAWRGDFITFWRVPPGYSVPLSMGSQGALVDAVGAQLAEQQGASAPAPDHVFDNALRARVAAFQQAQGLTPDGVAGPTTLMQINRASGVAEPWLAGTPPAVSAASSPALAQRK
ncbi:ExeA family protein [Scleromatobacter humisilvae]|uniref:AAA family ATPase n=1 Tax=Scleromatobacter humisilvae TaxID=2897159 RepID=A0A9X1YNP6_9BURK|nr:ExeA family protein [Scleromatobacter humisilvae]MCK9688123.1 AAA family ATPase [Scleromatobacter humisilvae]